MSYIDWHRVLALNTEMKNDNSQNEQNYPLICTAEATMNTEYHAWFYRIVQQLKLTQQCALVCIESDDKISHGLFMALTDTIAGFHYIPNDYYESLQVIQLM
jgi:hypothetical protein